MNEERLFIWDELELLWNAHNFGGVHDWLGERWNYLIQSRPDGQNDTDAQFLQCLAFAALALHFTRHHNQEGATLMADDALALLPAYLPTYRGLSVAPVLETLNTLRPLLDGIDNQAECPLHPFACNKLCYNQEAA